MADSVAATASAPGTKTILMNATLTFVLLPLVSLLVAGYFYVQTNLAHIQDNWVQYRCNPLVLPFASWFKDGKGAPVDSWANADFCMGNISHEVIAMNSSPISYMFSLIGKILHGIKDSVNSIRGLLTKIRSFLFDFLNQVMGKVMNVVSEVVTLLTRLRDIMSRMMAAGFVQVNLISTILSTLESFFQLAISFVKAMVYAVFAISILLAFIFPELLAFVIPLAAGMGIMFCFDPDTPVTIKGKLGTVSMKDVHIGDILVDPSGGSHVVEGTMKFACGNDVHMYDISGIHVSGGHKVRMPTGKWGYVSEHPAAVPAPAYDKNKGLVCLITDTNRIPVGTCMFTDFEEVSSEADIASIGQILQYGPNYSEPHHPGLHEDTLVRMADSSWKPIKQIQIGDQLVGNAVVDGVVCVDATDAPWVTIGAVQCTPTTWLNGGRRADSSFPVGTVRHAMNGPRQAFHLITRTGTFWVKNDAFVMCMQDYLDSHDPAKLQCIEQFVLGQLNSRQKTDS